MGHLNSKIDTVVIKFDHIEEPYSVERVQSKFLLMKNFYVYWKQFPLTVAYAITVQAFHWIVP